MWSSDAPCTTSMPRCKHVRTIKHWYQDWKTTIFLGKYGYPEGAGFALMKQPFAVMVQEGVDREQQRCYRDYLET